MYYVLTKNDAVQRVSDWTDTPPDLSHQGRAWLPCPADTSPATHTYTVQAGEVVASEKPAPEPPPIPPERQEIYTQALALLTEAEITEPPVDWKAAVAAAETYIDGAANTIADTKKRTKTLMKLLAIRDEIRDAGGSWEEALRYAADQQA